MRDAAIGIVIDLVILAGLLALGAAVYSALGQAALLAYIGALCLVVGGLAAWRRRPA